MTHWPGARARPGRAIPRNRPAPRRTPPAGGYEAGSSRRQSRRSCRSRAPCRGAPTAPASTRSARSGRRSASRSCPWWRPAPWPAVRPRRPRGPARQRHEGGASLQSAAVSDPRRPLATPIRYRTAGAARWRWSGVLDDRRRLPRGELGAHHRELGRGDVDLGLELGHPQDGLGSPGLGVVEPLGQGLALGLRAIGALGLGVELARGVGGPSLGRGQGDLELLDRGQGAVICFSMPAT